MSTSMSALASLSSKIISMSRSNHRSLSGDHIEYLPRVRRRGNMDGPGGREGSSTSHKLATLGMFYLVRMVGATGAGGERPATLVLASVLPLSQVGQASGCRVVGTVRRDVHLDGWDHVHNTNKHTLLHVDSITGRVMLVPHYDETLRASKMCVLPMWAAR